MVSGVQNHRDNVSADVFIHFVGGGMAGITAATSTYPLDLVRTRLAAQVRYSLFYLCLMLSSNILCLSCHPVQVNLILIVA